VALLFRQVLGRLESSGTAGEGYQIECKYWIARALFEQGDTEAAIPFLESALTQSKKGNGSPEPEGYFESRAEIQDLLRHLNEEVVMATPRTAHQF
jgi:hypothetical protein